MSCHATGGSRAGGWLTAGHRAVAYAHRPGSSTQDLSGSSPWVSAAARVRFRHAPTGSFTAAAGTLPRTAEAKQGTSITSMEEA
jgi:hypothetical protein